MAKSTRKIARVESFQQVMDYICPTCNGDLIESQRSTTSNDYFCQKCSISYPTIGHEIPLLINDDDNRENFFLEYGISLLSEQARLEKRISDIEQKIAAAETRSDILGLLIPAYKKNIAFLEKMSSLIEPHIDFKKMAKHLISSKSDDTLAPYPLPLHYFRRDWSGFKESEHEVSTIMEALKNIFVNRCFENQETAVVLGAGSGRLSYELASLFPKVIAIDYSASMAAGFLLAKENKHSFYEILGANIISPRDRLRRVNMNIPNTGPFPKNLKYCLASGLNAPLKSSSVSAVFSICFTDVVPFLPQLRETVRLLKPGGVFVHFGPLGFHYQDDTNHFTFEEMFDEFRSQGFRVQRGPVVRLPICASSHSLATTLFDNQVFWAKKMGINDNSILGFRGDLEVSVDGKMVSVREKNGVARQFSGVIALVLQKIDNKKSIGRITSLLKKNKISEDQKAKMLSEIEELVYDRILRCKF